MTPYIYSKPHFAAGKLVRFARGSFTGNDFLVVDWLIRVPDHDLDSISLAIKTESLAAKDYIFGFVDSRAPCSAYADDLNFDLRFIREPTT